MDHADRVNAVERELAGLVAAVGAGPLDAVVPTCPDFTVDDLAQHVGSFCGFWTHVLCEGSGRTKTPFDAVGSEGRVEYLEMLLYQRPIVGAVERFGDESVLDAFYREFTFT